MTDENWWRGAITYQIYPRSFQDDNGDGVGDLRGITRRLGHVADLGVDAIWLSPFFTSPMADMGYDVADHRDVDPVFGTLADFDALMARAHELGLKVIIDQVLSHTSDQHALFQESRSSRDNPKADWYLWRDAKPDGTPPNNWQAIFGGPAWTWDVRRRQYYYHSFLAAQPDLNFHVPEVQDWVLDAMRFWLDRGVDGFRLDTVNLYFQDKELRDNPVDHRMKNEPDYKTYEMQYPLHSKNQPENVVFVERMRALTDEYDARVLIGEIGESHRPAEIKAEYTTGARLHMAYDFALLTHVFTAEHLRRQVQVAFHEMPGGWPCWAFSNHDVPRHVSRWAHAGADQDRLAMLACALLMSMQGSICIYQGEELGLTQAELSYDELRDPEGLTFWPDHPGRDGCRTPMPWEAEAPHAGFSDADTTWLPVKPPHVARAVDGQAGDPESVLAFYRRMIAFRRDRADLRDGDTRFLDAAAPVLAFRRGQGTWCAFNLGPGRARADLPGASEILLGLDATLAGSAVELGPNGFAICA
ncbi:MAG: alpha-glucosidase [Pseudomonadota bacterium]